MTNNIDRARDIIEDLIDEPHMYPDGGLPDAAAQALDHDGLLTPDLPEPNDPTAHFVPDGKGWLLTDQDGPVVWTAPGGLVMIQRIEPGELTPEQAKGLAACILAAADHAEKDMPE